MKLFISNLFILAVLFFGVEYVNAQEVGESEMNEVNVQETSDITSSDETTTPEEEQSTEVGEEVVDEDTEVVDSGEMTEELTEEEILDILEENEVVDGDLIEELEDLEGEVIAVTDDEVIIETDSGEIIVVSTETYESKKSSSGSRKAKVGEKIETISVVVVEKNQDNWKITTKDGVFVVPMNTPVKVNGNVVALSEIKQIEDSAEIVVVTDSEGNVLELEILGDTEKESSTLLIGSIVAVIVILSGVLFFRKKEEIEEVSDIS